MNGKNNKMIWHQNDSVMQGWTFCRSNEIYGHQTTSVFQLAKYLHSTYGITSDVHAEYWGLLPSLLWRIKKTQQSTTHPDLNIQENKEISAELTKSKREKSERITKAEHIAYWH